MNRTHASSTLSHTGKEQLIKRLKGETVLFTSSLLQKTNQVCRKPVTFVKELCLVSVLKHGLVFNSVGHFSIVAIQCLSLCSKEKKPWSNSELWLDSQCFLIRCTIFAVSAGLTTNSFLLKAIGITLKSS